MLKKNGKKRYISKYTCTDRVILDVLKEYLTPMWKDSLSKYSYAYQENKGVQEAVKQCAQYIEAGREWVVEIDIKDFFDNVNIERLRSMITKKLNHPDLEKLINKYLYVMLQNDAKRYRKTIGLVQGSAISPLLSNVYMQNFDEYMEKYCYCRFSDNINVYCHSFEEAQKCMTDVQKYLWTKLGLECNKEKCGVYPSISRRFLGYEFFKENGSVFVK